MVEAKKNRIVIAAAGSGKTTRLINEAIGRPQSKILITTYTEANEAEIRKKFFERCGCVPSHVNVQTWYSFLLKHGVRPYQGQMTDRRIEGINLVSGRSAVYIKEGDLKHYIDKSNCIYTDKLSKFVLKCDELSGGRVIDRVASLFDEIFVDEVQDLAGYDLLVLEAFMDSTIRVLLVGDPRQGTYTTSNSPKLARFNKSKIIEYFRVLEKEREDVSIDDTTLLVNYRCNRDIRALSDSLYPDYPESGGSSVEVTGHDGIFFIRQAMADHYIERYQPIQLRHNITTKVSEKGDRMNFGASKGLTFDRVLIYPTKPYLEWIKDNSSQLATDSRAKLYVALTRARFSVGIIVSDRFFSKKFVFWSPDAY